MKIIAVLLGALAGALLPAGVAAQTRSARDTATAYGARLDARGLPANLNQRRVNNRLDNRIDNRLALRIERYRPENTANPTAAYAAQGAQTDKTRSNLVIKAPQQDDSDG